jgi:hypothetical protein
LIEGALSELVWFVISVESDTKAPVEVLNSSEVAATNVVLNVEAASI